MNIEKKEFNPFLGEIEKTFKEIAQKYEKLPPKERELKKAASILALAKNYAREQHLSPEEMREMIENIY